MSDNKYLEFSERLNSLMKKNDVSLRDISDHTKINYEMVRRYANGLAKPREEKMKLLADFLKTSVAYLDYGTNETIAQPAPYVLDRRGLGNVTPVDMSQMKLKKAPVLSWVQAGLPNAIGDNTWEEWEFYFDDNYGENVYWLHIKGDSMTPIFEEGDLILIDMDRQPRAGDYVIAIVDGDNEATFKKFKPCGYDEKLGREYCQLIALNDFYPPYDSRFTRINIIGTVVEFKKKFV